MSMEFRSGRARDHGGTGSLCRRAGDAGDRSVGRSFVPCRAGLGVRRVVAANRRDGHVLQLDPADLSLCRRADGTRTVGELVCSDDDADFLDVLGNDGFLTERPPKLDCPPSKARGSRNESLLPRHARRALPPNRSRRASRVPSRAAAGVSSARRIGAGLLASAGVAALVAAFGSGQRLELHASAGHLPLLLLIAAVAVFAQRLARTR